MLTLLIITQYKHFTYYLFYHILLLFFNAYIAVLDCYVTGSDYVSRSKVCTNSILCYPNKG